MFERGEKQVDAIQEMEETLRQQCPTDRIFQLYRLVNPETNEVFRYRGDKLLKTGQHCFDIWNRTRPCRNCISKRACGQSRQIMKMEYLQGRVHLIWAVPVTLPDEKVYSLELARDVTDSMMVSDVLHQDNTDITSLILEFNEVAIKDNFTGLYNKQYIETELPLVIRRTEQEECPITAAIVDIDRFKQVNDQYGHRTGDEVIRVLCDYIRDAVDDGENWAARMGGDEFLLVFEQPLAGAQQRCDELARRFAAHSFGGEETPFQVTVSIGLEQYQPSWDTEAFLECVDQRMYEAKGRRFSN